MSRGRPKELDGARRIQCVLDRPTIDWLDTYQQRLAVTRSEAIRRCVRFAQYALERGEG